MTAPLKVSSVKSVTNAGFSLTRSGGDSNPNPIQHGTMGQAERAFSAASTFLSGAVAISASQFIGAPLKWIDPAFYEAYMAWTKESFAVLITTVTQWWAPTVVRVSGDESMKGQLFQMPDGSLRCNFPHRLVLMANHQLYTDWMYLWWIAYTNKTHGHIYIILKESLKQLPIIGWGAQFYNFIFLSRKWEKDRSRFKKAFSHLKDANNPMWLLIFPEGTNLSATTRERSASWARKTGIPDMKNQLLPRKTGLQFCLRDLRQSTNWLYDCTIAYEGVPKGQYGQDIFTLRSSLFEGRPPKSVNMFWRRFRISDIPLDNDEAFTRWLNNRWREKDYILEYFFKFGVFPSCSPSEALSAVEGRQQPKSAKMISTLVKAGGWDEFLGIFGPLTSAAGALSTIDLTEPNKVAAMMDGLLSPRSMPRLTSYKQPLPATSQEAIRRALREAQKKKPLPQPMFDKLIKEAPRTQGEMKKVLQQTNIPARMEPAAPAAVRKARSLSPQPSPTQQQDLLPAPRKIQGAMSLANKESMITRPLTTMAVHTAANSMGKIAANARGPQKRSQTKAMGPTDKTNIQKTPPAPTKVGPGKTKPAKLTGANLAKVNGEALLASGTQQNIPSTAVSS